MKYTCADCKHFLKSSVGELGRCYAHPPTLLNSRIQPLWDYPRVSDLYRGCGEFVKKEESK